MKNREGMIFYLKNGLNRKLSRSFLLPNFLTEREAADILQCSMRTIHHKKKAQSHARNRSAQKQYTEKNIQTSEEIKNLGARISDAPKNVFLRFSVTSDIPLPSKMRTAHVSP
ncbi:MAG: hypothetical protein PUK05_06880 [Peptoniphilaceae bacterium]|nr:hypothetical protein [Peptoniphilaceae bacterium]